MAFNLNRPKSIRERLLRAGIDIFQRRMAGGPPGTPPTPPLTVEDILNDPAWSVLTDQFDDDTAVVPGGGASGSDWADERATRDPAHGIRGVVDDNGLITALNTYPTDSTSVSNETLGWLSDSYGQNGNYVPNLPDNDDNAQTVCYLAELGRLQTLLISGGGWNMGDARAAYEAHIGDNPGDASLSWGISIQNGPKGGEDIEDMITDLEAIKDSVEGAGGEIFIALSPLEGIDSGWAVEWNTRIKSDYPGLWVATVDPANQFPDGTHPNRATAERMAAAIWDYMVNERTLATLGFTFTTQVGVDPIAGTFYGFGTPLNYSGEDAAGQRHIIFAAGTRIAFTYTDTPYKALMSRGADAGGAQVDQSTLVAHDVTQGKVDTWALMWRGVSIFGQFNGVKQATKFQTLARKWQPIDSSNPVAFGSGNTKKGEQRFVLLYKRGSQATDEELAVLNAAFQGITWDDSHDADYVLWDDTAKNTGATVDVIANGGRSRINTSPTDQGICLVERGIDLNTGPVAWEIRHNGSTAGNRSITGVAKRRAGTYDINPLTDDDVVAFYANDGKVYNNDGGVAFFGSPPLANNYYLRYEWRPANQELTVYWKQAVGDAYALIGTIGMAGKMGTAEAPEVWYPMGGVRFDGDGGAFDYDFIGDQGAFTDSTVLSEDLLPLSDAPPLGS